MKKNYQQNLGRFGEEIARKYLEKNNYQIIDENYHTRQGEIDLICQKDNWYIFIEVKTRTNDSFGQPEESVDEKKLKKFQETISKYIIENGLTDKKWRVEVLAIIIDKKTGKSKIRHLKEI